MAELAGKSGSVTGIATAATSIKNWSMSLAGDALETTDFDDSGARTYIPGLTGWSGSFECNYSTGNTAVPGSTGTIICKTSTGTVGLFTGGIIITGMDVSTPIDGIVTQSYTFQGTGAVSTSTGG